MFVCFFIVCVFCLACCFLLEKILTQNAQFILNGLISIILYDISHVTQNYICTCMFVQKVEENIYFMYFMPCT